MARRLRIVQTPLGGAPEHVRRAWVGLELPLLADSDDFVESVQELPDDWRTGFAVPVLAALEVLQRHRPLEAAWWRHNAAELCHSGSTFVFDRACGEVIDE